MKPTQLLFKGLILSFALLFATLLIAQRSGTGTAMGTLFGELRDESGTQPLEFATIALYSVRDSMLVTGGITDMAGTFSFDVRPGRYYLKAQFIGFGEKTIDGIQVGRNNLNVDLGTITLEESEVRLDEITVQGERTEMELRLDKKVYNIGKDLSNLGGSASDLLANLPSMEVDVDGNVSLRGSENVQILIDGKPSNLIGLSGSGGLSQLQGNLIESVEVITNPSARYDAEGGAGIINIILKKERAKGFNGSFQLQTGYPASHGASVNVNYRTGWINWFVNYGVTFRRSPSESTTDIYEPSADSTYEDQFRERNRESLSQNIRFGSDIYLNKKNIITLSASYRNSDEENRTYTYFDYFDANRAIVGNRLRKDFEEEDDLNWQYALNFTRNFNRKGQKLTFDLQYQDSNEVEQSEFDDTDPSNDSDKSLNDNGEKRTLVQWDYVQPFSRTGVIEGGMRYTFRNIYNDFLVEGETSPDVYEEVPEFTNNFNFEEGVLAGYIMVSNSIDKFSWQVGTRLEQTDLKTELIQTSERNDQNYLNFFPSANLTQKLSEEQSLQLSYSRRISRPRYRSLNPFTSLSNPRNIYRGNPNLRPQFTNSYELGFLINKENSSIYYGIYHRHTDDVVQRIQTLVDGIFYLEPQNLAVQNDLGMELNISKEFSRNFRTTGNFNLFNSKTEGEDLFANATDFAFRLGSFYKNDKFLNAQMNLYYRAPRKTTQGKTLSMSNVDIGLSRDVMKKNGTLSMNVRDLFNTRKYRSSTTTETFSTDGVYQRRKGPTFVLSFTYRLNQSNKHERGSRGSEGGGDEFDGDF